MMGSAEPEIGVGVRLGRSLALPIETPPNSHFELGMKRGHQEKGSELLFGGMKRGQNYYLR
jgi:hypothetical protein